MVQCALFLACCSARAGAGEYPPAVVKAEFVYTDAPFEQCHASTIAETEDGLVAAWFGGECEGHPSVGIWVSRHDGTGWTPPIQAADGQTKQGLKACGNPVLYQPTSGPLLLFYKVGPPASQWWGMRRVSEDGGKTWSEGERLPDGILGPVKNKPIPLPDGSLLCGSSTEHDGWRVHFEITPDLGKTWTTIGPVNDGEAFAAIQPTLLTYPDGRIQALCRSRQRRIVQVWSKDNGRSWSEMTATELPNPSSGIDGVTLADGRQLLVYNHRRGRGVLNVAVSTDGKSWQAAFELENARSEFSYPAVIQTDDGLVHTTYTWKRRRVKHVVMDPKKLELRPIRDGRWPK
jgi:predicted neuraminidase